MRTAIILASTVILTSHAFAQISPNSPGKFCLRGQSGATQGTEICGYQTMAQCEAAKAGQNDLCVSNSKLKSSTIGSGTKR